MRPRTELAIGFALLFVLGTGAALLGSRRGGTKDEDPRRSTFLATPQGARGWAEGLERLGVAVTRYRRAPRELRHHPAPAAARRPLFAVLDPAQPLAPAEARVLLADTTRDLLAAGARAGGLLGCFGYQVTRLRDSTPLRVASTLGHPAPRVAAALTRAAERPGNRADEGDEADEAEGAEGAEAGDFDGTNAACRAPTPVAVDTLAALGDGRPAAVRLTLPGGRRVTLVADGKLFSNRALRETAAGEFALGLVVGAYDRLVVDEFHQGFAASGSLSAALLAWSVRSPWGWTLWQLGVAALVALAAAGIRFGPARSIISRRRRSPLEHVEALATALAAARGHDLAVRLLVRGLRRRLARRTDGARAPELPRGGEAAWLATLAGAARTTQARAAIADLQSLTASPQQSAAGVLRAAHAVEDVWQDLRP
jgi:hypothetical protein